MVGPREAGRLSAGNDLQNEAETEGRYHVRLTALADVSRQLCRAESFDDLCRQVIELGRSRLGFDRLSLWFVEADGKTLRGTFGVDEQGCIRDERHARLLDQPLSSRRKLLRDNVPILFQEEGANLRDHQGVNVGRGSQAKVALWDGEEIVGILFCDNLLSRQPITRRMREMLVLYANLIGPLCTLKRTEEALRASEARYRELIERLPVVTYTTPPDHLEADYVSPQIEALTGYTLEEWRSVPRRFGWCLHPEDRERVVAEVTAARAARIPLNTEYRLVCCGGRVKWVHDTARLICDASGQPLCVQGVLQDITARKQAEMALRESEARLRLAMLVGRMGTFDWHLQTNEIHCSEEMATMLGLSPDQLGRTLTQIQTLVHPGDREGFHSAFQTAIEGKGELEHECRFQLPDGSVRWILTIGRVLHNRTGRPVHLLGVAMDVTERHQLHEELLQAQKMEGIGRLAGGVAHDFNNLLTAILGYAELAEREIPPNHPLRSHLAQIQQAASRAADLTQRLLSFARKQRMEPRLVDLNTLLQNLVPMLRLLIGGNIELILRPQEELWLIRADPNHLEQLVINLAVNARDAMPQGGRLTVETASVTLGPDEAKTWTEGVPGDFVRLSVSDTGVGMDSAVVRNIFDPFYTTKEMGKGTGLGLAICLGVVKQHNGHIVVRSEPGRGSTFHIHLPRAARL